MGVTGAAPFPDTHPNISEQATSMTSADSDLRASSFAGPRWDLYRYFLAVAKTESITGAAQLLRESPPTVSRRVRELETHFRDALFRRSPGRLSPTQAGVRLRERLGRVDMDLAALQSDFLSAREDLKGHVTITAPRGFGKAVLLSCLGELRRELPDVSFTTVFKTKKANLSRREADIAVRIGDPGDESLTSHRIGEISFSVYASASYLNRHGPPTSASDLRSADFIGLERGDDLVQIREMRAIAPHLSPGLSVDCILLQAQTVALGFGFAPLPDYLTASFPDLVRILPGALDQRADIWILSQPDFQNSACVRATVQRLVDATQAALAKTAGR